MISNNFSFNGIKWEDCEKLLKELTEITELRQKHMDVYDYGKFFSDSSKRSVDAHFSCTFTDKIKDFVTADYYKKNEVNIAEDDDEYI